MKEACRAERRADEKEAGPAAVHRADGLGRGVIPRSRDQGIAENICCVRGSSFKISPAGTSSSRS